MPFRQDLKKQFRSFFGKRDIPELIQDKQIVSDVPLDKTLQRLFLSGFDQFIDQTVATGKEGPKLFL